MPRHDREATYEDCETRVTDRSASDVAREIERLRTHDLRSIEAGTTEKRRAWLRRHLPDPASLGAVSPRRAYELLFRDYMGLSLADLPVISESEREIAWRSKNDCPTLEACRALGLDTRSVCRSAYEKPTQAFLSWLDPRLRFLRDYEFIRPHAPHCLERIVLIDFESFMEQALEEAALSLAEGNKGYGAVLALGDRVLAKTHDTATTEGDPSLHAEFKAMRQAIAAQGLSDLCGAVLYSTCEPCPMCTGLAVWANLTSIVYGASIADTARMGRSRILIGRCRDRRTVSLATRSDRRGPQREVRSSLRLGPVGAGRSATGLRVTEDRLQRRYSAGDDRVGREQTRSVEVIVKALRTDLSIFERFEFEYAPVGVKFLFERPEGIEQLQKTLPFCQMVREAQERRAPFYFAKENEDCFGTMTLGMVDVPPFAEAGILGERFEVFQEPRANQRIYQHIMKFPKGTVNYVAYSVIAALTFEPDLLIVMATPSQAEIIMRALSYTTGELWESKKTPVMGCSWIYNYPYLTGKVNYMVTGMSFGAKAKEVFPEGWLLISIPWDKLVTVVQSLEEMKWVLPSYAEGRDKFSQREAQLREECFRSMESI